MHYAGPGFLPVREKFRRIVREKFPAQHKYNILRLRLFFMTEVPRIVLDPSVLAGKPIIRGTRISVDFILELLASGWTESAVLHEYPGLGRDDILACIRYAQEIVRDERVYATPHQGKSTG